MNAAYDLDQVPLSHMLNCGAKLVAMLIQNTLEAYQFREGLVQTAERATEQPLTPPPR